MNFSIFARFFELKMRKNQKKAKKKSAARLADALAGRTLIPGCDSEGFFLPEDGQIGAFLLLTVVPQKPLANSVTLPTA